MRIATGQYDGASDENLRFARELGVEEVVLNTPALPGTERWEFIDLVNLRTRCESFGLRLAALENTPVTFYDRAMLGLPGADEQLEHYAETIRNMGRAGIPVLGFHWMPNGVWRTTWTARTRTGALTNGFDLELAKNAPLTHGRAFEEEELWATFERFVRTLVPVAEEFGVRLALHPDDPPVPTLGGLPRLFRSFEAFRRGLELVDSPALGLDFCVGSWSEMGTDVLEAIRYFGSRDKIVYVHFRDVDGVVPAFTECALGDGNLDPSEVMDALLEVDFDGFAIFDHAPLLVGDEDWPWRGEAHQTGYLMGLLAAKRPRAVR